MGNVKKHNEEENSVQDRVNNYDYIEELLGYSLSPQQLKEVVNKALLPTNDIIFHCLFGTVGNERITKKFIERILNREVSEIELDLNLNLIREQHESKLGTLDVRAKALDGENYNIEMQNVAVEQLPERILSYWSRLFNADLKRGNDYTKLKKTIVILIVNDNIKKFDMIKKYHTKWNIREEDYINVIFSEHLEIHIVELKKYKKMRENNENEWLDFIIEPNSKEVMKAMQEVEELKEAKRKWNRITAEDKVRDRAMRLEIAELDYNTGLKMAREAGEAQGYKRGEAQGEANGKKDTSIQIAKKLLEKGMSIEDIMDATGLTREEIEKL